MKQIIFDFETYKKEQQEERYKGFKEGFYIACETIKELIDDKPLYHFDGSSNSDIIMLDQLCDALTHGTVPKNLKNPFRRD